MNMEQAREVLRRHYGYETFRPGQVGVIENVLRGQDTLGIMPTGGGKSICYQVPAMLMPGLTLVISPLISLMKDQVDALHSVGIPAAYINSSLSAAEANERMAGARQGAYKLLYVAPERLESERFWQELQTLPLSMIAVDEAHCISQWGHDFRPSYRAIPRILDFLPERPLVTAFTATATPEVMQDILQLLHIEPSDVFLNGFNRENLAFSVLRGENKRDFVEHFLKQREEEAGVIYCATRKEVDALYEGLRQRGHAVGKYHAGMTEEERAAYQDQFLFDDVRILVATNAFGMGIDKSNVRWVLHFNMPKNMESYYQEAGRAGRDGEPSQCILLYHPQDVQLQKYLIEQSTMAPERKANEYKKMQTMVDYCHTTRCLRNHILLYFGDEEMEPCGVCSNCRDESEVKDITLEAQKIFSCVRRMKERYGASLVAQVLKGSSNKKVLQFRFDQLPTYGLMKEYKEKEITDLIHLLTAEGYLALSDGQFPVVKLSARAVPVLQGQELVLQKVRVSREEAKADTRLFDLLRQLRKDISAQEKVPPYIIFADSTLREMSEQCPTDEYGMLRIKGVGESKFVRYGAPFLQLLQEYAEQHGIQKRESSALEGASGSAASSARSATDSGTPTHLQSLELFQAGRTLDEIAEQRGLKRVTVEDHIIRSAVEGHELDWDSILDPTREAQILAAADEHGAEKLRPLKDVLPPEIEYFEIKAALTKRALQGVEATEDVVVE